MATRRNKTFVRLEKGEGKERAFWEISRTKTTLTTRFGKHLSAGRTTVKELRDTQKAYDEAIAAKLAEGYVEPIPQAVVGATSRSGVSARNPELEALIEEDPNDLSRYLIYGDWLQQQGDPRGELVV